jgi:hypothetical protein
MYLEKCQLSFFRGDMPSATTEIAHIPTSSKGEGEIHIASLNCKNLKTSAYIIEELLKQHQIILIQEHWLFEAQINTIGDPVIEFIDIVMASF